jgi:uncharacterized membrane protein
MDHFVKTYVDMASYSEMESRRSKSIVQTLSIGIIAGMRSASAPAIACYMLSKNKSDELTNSPLKFMKSESLANVLKVLAIGELIVDKLPSTPPRIKPAGVLARVISGSLSAAAISKAKGSSAIAAAILGSTAAFASTFFFYFLRKRTGEKLKIYDQILGTLEDVLVIGIGVELSQSF